MATQIRPFMMTGAVLATAASIVAASPAIAPSIALPSTNALSSAKVELTTFSDIFTIPAGEWSLAAFQGYGGLVGSLDGTNPNPYAPGCNFNCYVLGPSGITYLAADALINGNGHGWDTAGGVLTDPTKPYNAETNPYVIQPWGISAINYFYEGALYYGISPGMQYLAQNAIGSSSPILSTLISLVFAGPTLVTQVWTSAWNLAAGLLSKLPLVGTVASNGIYAYLGTLYNAKTSSYYQQGLSGTLNYLIDQITGGYAPPVVAPGAAALRAAASKAVTPALSVAAPSAALTAAKSATAVSEAVSTAKVESVETPSATDSKSETSSATETKTDDTKPETTSATDSKADDTKPADTSATDSKPVVTPAADTKSVETKTADTATAGTPAAVTPAATKAADKPAKATRPHPVRDAVEKAGKQIANAVANAKAAKGSAN